MAHALGCLGSPVEVYRTEKRASQERKRTRRRLRGFDKPSVRNQQRELRIAIVSRDWSPFVKLVKVRDGHLKHVRAAYYFGKAKYLT